MIKKTICIITALVALFAFSMVALAATPEASWHGNCYNQFTTSNSISKPSGTDWFGFIGYLDDAVCTPDDYYPYVRIKLVSSTGYTMGKFKDLYGATGLDWDGVSQYTNVKLIVKNPYGPSGPLLHSQGRWEGMW